MARDPRPVFLERKTYRRRRMMDGLRVVFVFGVVLWLMPVLWPVAESDDIRSVPMSRALFYVFGVWIGLIGVAGLLAYGLRDQSDWNAPDDQTAESEK